MDDDENSMPPTRKTFEENGIYWITRAIAQGGYPDETDCRLLRAGGVTHLFNFDLPYLDAELFKQMGFSGIVWKPIVDGRLIPKPVLLDCLDAIHQSLMLEGSKIFVHCHAGINRSPTILSLYFVACGIEPVAACKLIESASPYAVPGHPALCDASYVEFVQRHGREKYLPLLRPNVLS